MVDYIPGIFAVKRARRKGAMHGAGESTEYTRKRAKLGRFEKGSTQDTNGVKISPVCGRRTMS